MTSAYLNEMFMLLCLYVYVYMNCISVLRVEIQFSCTVIALNSQSVAQGDEKFRFVVMILKKIFL